MSRQLLKSATGLMTLPPFDVGMLAPATAKLPAVAHLVAAS
jgi:hypothetical protein